MVGCRSTPSSSPDAGSQARLESIGPWLLSNQTSHPVSIRGRGFQEPLTLSLGPPANRRVAVKVLDATHAVARIPGEVGLGDAAEVLVPARLEHVEGEVQLRFVNDTRFADLTALELSLDGSRAFVASGNEDRIYAVTLTTGTIETVETFDGPSALAIWVDAKRRAWVVVAHQYTPKLLLIATDNLERKEVPAVAGVAGIVVSAEGVAFVAEHIDDSVVAIDLASAEQRWRWNVDPNPRALAVTPEGLFVGSLQTGSVALLEPKKGEPQITLEPKPGTAIVGGSTKAFSKYVMNGKAPRGFAYSARLKQLFVSSIGPNIGPNPEKMEVSMNGGVGVLDRNGWLRHLGFGAGVTEGLALDDEKGLLYAADPALGLVRVLDVKRLSASDRSATNALIQELRILPPASFPLVRPAQDFGVEGRAGVELHSGPRIARLSLKGTQLVVLNRFTASLAIVDVVAAAKGHASVVRQLPIVNPLVQKTRRLGQVLYFADLGRTAMSCDACHLEGHTEGMLFEKTVPLRIYRSPTVRGSRETPPFFTPASTFSMGETAKVVGGRNRFHNPNPSPEEIEALTLYASLIPTLPNPHRAVDGSFDEALALPDGRTGNARAGLALFEGKAACAGCHPGPYFTTDQDKATRGKFIDVGTPRVMPLREAMQNTHFEGFAPPALAGAWDVFPMLTTGLAGLEVTPAGAIRVKDRFCLKPAIENWSPEHGRADLLNEQERADLLAYVLSL